MHQSAESKQTSLPSCLHVWLSPKTGMTCTWGALESSDRDSAELSGSGLALSLLLASLIGKFIAVVILHFVPVYTPGIRYLNDIK